MYPIVKRSFDFLFSLLAIVLLAPLWLVLIPALLFTGEGYVFYRQQRIGYRARPFGIFKFATMLKDSPNMPGGLITQKKDPRLTPLGGFLRRSKINELPQLFNILLGHMSFVGPRPLVKKSFDVYPDVVRNNIYNVRPGLTGIGSLVFRDEEMLIQQAKDAGQDEWEFYSECIYPFKGALEMWYLSQVGFLTDFKILVLTALAVLMPDSKLVYKVFPALPANPVQPDPAA